jgi:hypothetical protein
MAVTVSSRARMDASPFTLSVTDAATGTALTLNSTTWPDPTLSGYLSLTVTTDGEQVVLCKAGETAAVTDFPKDQTQWAQRDASTYWTMRTPLMTYADFTALRLKASTASTAVSCRFILVREQGS